MIGGSLSTIAPTSAFKGIDCPSKTEKAGAARDSSKEAKSGEEAER